MSSYLELAKRIWETIRLTINTINPFFYLLINKNIKYAETIALLLFITIIIIAIIIIKKINSRR